jgi:hypothetical protein
VIITISRETKKDCIMCVNWIGLVEIQYLLKKEPSQDKKIRSMCKTYYANKGMRKKNTSEK